MWHQKADVVEWNVLLRAAGGGSHFGIPSYIKKKKNPHY